MSGFEPIPASMRAETTPQNMKMSLDKHYELKEKQARWSLDKEYEFKEKQERWRRMDRNCSAEQKELDSEWSIYWTRLDEEDAISLRWNQHYELIQSRYQQYESWHQERQHKEEFTAQQQRHQHERLLGRQIPGSGTLGFVQTEIISVECHEMERRDTGRVRGKRLRPQKGVSQADEQAEDRDQIDVERWEQHGNQVGQYNQLIRERHIHHSRLIQERQMQHETYMRELEDEHQKFMRNPLSEKAMRNFLSERSLRSHTAFSDRSTMAPPTGLQQESGITSPSSGIICPICCCRNVPPHNCNGRPLHFHERVHDSPQTKEFELVKQDSRREDPPSYETISGNIERTRRNKSNLGATLRRWWRSGR